MSFDSPTQTNLEQKRKSTEKHLEEVDEMLTEIDRRISKPECTNFRQNIERADHYSQDKNYWEDQTSITRGNTSIKDDKELSNPEKHAKGANKLKQEHNLDVTTIAQIKIDGIGKYSAIQAKYEISIDFDEGINYRLEKSDDTAKDKNSDIANQDLTYLKNQLESVIEEYNQKEEDTLISPNWTYGQSTAQSLDD